MLYALTFKISFFTAQFRKHYVKLYRDTYLIPLPSTVAGIIGAILGIKRKKLVDFAKKVNLYCGAELLSYEGYINEYVRIFKFSKTKKEKILMDLKNPKEAKKIQPVYKSISLYEPKYKLAIAMSDLEIYRDLLRRIRELDFTYDIFGGNDYNFVRNIWDTKEATFMKSAQGRGYCPQRFFKDLSQGDHILVVNDMVLSKVKEKYILVYGGDIILNREIECVDDRESKILVYLASNFLVSKLLTEGT